MNGVKHVDVQTVAPYHAASNGLTEWMVQSFKNLQRQQTDDSPAYSVHTGQLSIHPQVEPHLVCSLDMNYELG